MLGNPTPRALQLKIKLIYRSRAALRATQAGDMGLGVRQSVGDRGGSIRCALPHPHKGAVLSRLRSSSACVSLPTFIADSESCS